MILPISHVVQQEEGDCLVACVAMALTHIGFRVSYQRLRKVFEVMPGYGTPAPNVLRLQRFGMHVGYGQGTLAIIQQHLLQLHPIIAFVTTGQLHYWRYSTQHAVLVIGMDGKFIYLNDPELTFGPIAVPMGEFDLAWLERDEMYAVITRQT